MGLLTVPQSPAAQKQGANRPAVACQASVLAATKVASQLSLATSVSEKVQLLDKFEVIVNFSGDATSTATGGVGIIVALSANAQLKTPTTTSWSGGRARTSATTMPSASTPSKICSEQPPSSAIPKRKNRQVRSQGLGHISNHFELDGFGRLG